MPYIRNDKRKEVDPLINELFKKFDTAQIDVGLLNYTISKLLWDLFRDNKKYKAANDIIGVLQCIQLEIYRKQFAGYEDLKESEHGSL